MPAINTFDNSILPNLVTFIKNYNEIYKIYEKSIDKIDYYEKYCIIDNSNGIMFYEYYKKIFTMICLNYKIKFVKNKAIEYLIECLQKNFEKRIDSNTTRNTNRNTTHQITLLNEYNRIHNSTR